MDPWDLTSDSQLSHPEEKASVLRPEEAAWLVLEGGGEPVLGQLLSRAASHPKRLGTHSGQAH